MNVFHYLLASLLVIGLTLYASRWVSAWQRQAFRGRRMRVLEGLPVGRDRQIYLVSVGKQVMVVASTPQGVTVLHQVADPEEAAALLAEEPAAQEIHPLQLPAGLASAAQQAEEAVRAHLGRMRTLLAKAGERHEK